MGMGKRRVRRGAPRWAAICGALGVVAAGLVIASSATSSATTTRPEPPAGYVAAGTVRIKTGSVDEVVWQAEPTAGQTSGARLGRQGLSARNCVLKSTGPDTLVAFTAGSKVPGFADNSIGVLDAYGGHVTASSSSSSSGTSCSRVDASRGEALTVALAGKLTEGLVHRAELDIEVRSGAKIVATLFDGTTAAGRFELRSGSSIVSGQGSTTPGSPIFNCSGGHHSNLSSESGSSGTSDNCRWVFNGLFDKVTLTAKAGSFSLEGGADASGLAPSTFFLAEDAPTGTVTCPSDVGPGTTSDLVPQTGDDYTVTGSRGEDADGRALCVPVDYDLTFDGTTLDFTKRGPLNPNATFLFRTTFSPEPTGTGGGTFGLAPTKHRFDNDPTNTVFDLEGCEGTPVYDGNGDFAGIADVLTAPGFDLVPGAPGVQYACVFDESAELVGSGLVQLTQGVYLIGDWTKFR